MATLTESLEKRIQQLQASIETQQRQLAVYQQALALEQGSSASPLPSSDQAGTDQLATEAARPPSPVRSGPTFTGNKTEFIATLVQARGHTGASPKEIAEALAEHGIERGRNLIYSVLSGLVKQRKLKKQGDRYVAVATATRSRQKRRAGKPARSQPVPAKRATARSKTASRGGAQRVPRPAPRAGAKTVAAKHAATQTGG